MTAPRDDGGAPRYKCGCDVLPWCSIHGEPFATPAGTDAAPDQSGDDQREADVLRDRSPPSPDPTPAAAPDEDAGGGK